MCSAVGAAGGKRQERWWLAVTRCKHAAKLCSEGTNLPGAPLPREWPRGVAVVIPLSATSRKAESWRFSPNFSCYKPSPVALTPSTPRPCHSTLGVRSRCTEAMSMPTRPRQEGGHIQPGLWGPHGPQFPTTTMCFPLDEGKPGCAIMDVSQRGSGVLVLCSADI